MTANTSWAAAHVEAPSGKGKKWATIRARQTDLIRDIFGNPFRSTPVNPSWLKWNGGVVRKMAEAIYEERRFAELPILADALEDAGCSDSDLLSHCRGAGPHVRGCWVVDLILGKQ